MSVTAGENFVQPDNDNVADEPLVFGTHPITANTKMSFAL
jgi:hypothetical protein